MKKFIIGLVATVMVAVGLVATSEVTASAAPYPGTVATSTSAVGLGPFRHKAKVFVRVISNSGKPHGRLNFTFVNKKSGKVKSFSRQYGGGGHTYTFSPLKKGKYGVLVTFMPRNGSKWKPSTGKTHVKVR
ncbi:hypothetical protein [Nocardioides sp.]|uniref:hypothetical protein n=1 Tax=Nocardioides sp. TaxID=35761 RepID=UPI0037837273